MQFFKNFLDWFILKPKVDNLDQRPLFQEREVWDCYWGVNIGFELDGKNDKFIRPVLVLKKLTHNTFLGLVISQNILCIFHSNNITKIILNIMDFFHIFVSVFIQMSIFFKNILTFYYSLAFSDRIYKIIK